LFAVVLIAVACAGVSVQPGPLPSAGFHVGDCGFVMIPDAGTCELWFSEVVFSDAGSEGPSARVSDGYKMLACGEKYPVCGGKFTCTCPR
jgi:hypothetical protein